MDASNFPTVDGDTKWTLKCHFWLAPVCFHPFASLAHSFYTYPVILMCMMKYYPSMYQILIQ